MEPVRVGNLEGVQNDLNAVPPLGPGDPQNISNRQIKQILAEVTNQRRKAEETRLAQQAELAKPRPLVDCQVVLEDNRDRV